MGTIRIFWKLNMALGKVFFGELIAQYINLPNFCDLIFFFLTVTGGGELPT